jgi:integrase/recombinase XerD
MLYAYETIPSALSLDQIATILKSMRNDHSSLGLRDYAILQLLATYGLRSGEITRLTLNDIDWRAAPCASTIPRPAHTLSCRSCDP